MLHHVLILFTLWHHSSRDENPQILTLALTLWEEVNYGWKEVVSFPKLTFYFKFTLFYHFHIACLSHPLRPPTSPAKQNLFCPLVLWFCWRENVAFMLVWDKDSYTTIQRDSWHYFHAHVYRNPHWFIFTRPLHYFLVPFPLWPLPH
jgi:hypothetical protein